MLARTVSWLDAGAHGDRTKILLYHLFRVDSIFHRFGGERRVGLLCRLFCFTALNAQGIVVVAIPEMGAAVGCGGPRHRDSRERQPLRNLADKPPLQFHAFGQLLQRGRPCVRRARCKPASAPTAAPLRFPMRASPRYAKVPDPLWERQLRSR